MSFFKGFGYAFCGIIHCIIYEPNIRVHTVFTLYVLVFARFFNFSRGEWVLLLLTIGGILAAEAVNTSIEALCDRVCPGRDDKIKTAKDAAAGAVLILAVFAAVIGVIMFSSAEGWKNAYDYFTGNITAMCLLCAVTAASVLFILMPRKRKKEGKDKSD